MKFQTPKNDPINRDDEDRLEIKNEIIATWLGKGDIFQLFDDDVQRNIDEVRQLLDSENKEDLMAK